MTTRIDSPGQNTKPSSHALHAESLQQILELNTRLAHINQEQELLEEALLGISIALGLKNITCYSRRRNDNRWIIRATTDQRLQQGKIVPSETANLLEFSLTEQDGILRYRQSGATRGGITAIFPLLAGDIPLGAIQANVALLDESLYTAENFGILLKTFSQNLASLWHKLILYAEVQQRAQELEILQGQHLDTIWNSDNVVVQASISDKGFHVSRKMTPGPEKNGRPLPLQIGDSQIGEIVIPDAPSLSESQAEFVQTLLREMGNALNNAYLLQTTRNYANQLAVATEVSRAATTILDRDILIREVVNLILSGFEFYYVGLFLVDEMENTAVLRAGTGPAGKAQLEQSHRLAIGGDSMIGACIARKQAIVEQDVSEAETFSYNPLLPKTRSELALPLRTHGRIIGALTVQSTVRGAFTHELVAVLQNLADQLAIAIETANFFAQTQEALAETSRLYETSQKMSKATTPLDVYQVLIDFASASNLVDVAQIITSAPNRPGTLISPVLWSRTGHEHHSEHRFPGPLFQFGQHLPRNELILIDDTATDPRLDKTTRNLFHRNKLRATALVPIHVEADWLGTLALHWLKPKPISSNELQPFQTLVDQAATILSNQQLLAEIRQANEQLRQLDQLKTQFLANMSHELRTPLNSIIGFSRVILKGIDGPTTVEQQEDLTSIHNNGQHLLRLINEILDMAKIEAGKMVLAFEKIDLAETARAAIDTIRSLSQEKGLDLSWEIAPDLPAIAADPVRLRQILNNLLSNAVKYTDVGSVDLKIFQKDEEHVQITVKDTGIGISPEDFDKLFRAFEQIDSSTTRSVGGTGLGLPITKWLVNMHSGSIELDSDVGKGSTFHVILPIYHDKDAISEIMTFSESLRRQAE